MANSLTDAPGGGGWNTPAAGNLAEAVARRGPTNTMAGLAEGIASGAAAAAQGYFHRQQLHLQAAQLELEGSKVTAANRALLDHPHEMQYAQNSETIRAYAERGVEPPEWLAKQNDWLASYLRHDGSVDKLGEFPTTGKLPATVSPREYGADISFMERGGRISNTPIENAPVAGAEGPTQFAPGQIQLGDKYYLMPPETLAKARTGNEPKVHSVEIGADGSLYSVSNVPGAAATKVTDESGKPITVKNNSDTVTVQGERLGAVRNANGKIIGYATIPTMRPVDEVWTAQPGNLVPWYKGGKHGALPAVTMEDFTKGSVDALTMARAKELYRANPMASENEILSILNTERNVK